MKKRTVKVARLDHDRVYWGLEDKPLSGVKSGDLVFGPPEIAGEIPEGALYVAADCDLPAGVQKWTGRTFEPLPSGQRKASPAAPTLEQALYDFLTLGPEAPRVKAWVAWMKQSMDEGKS